jgi:hypothetical protein
VLGLALMNPVGVITLGCTCEAQAPSHLLTLTSLLQVRCSRPRSSNSSEKSNHDIFSVIIYLRSFNSVIYMLIFLCNQNSSSICRTILWNVNTGSCVKKSFHFVAFSCSLLESEPLASCYINYTWPNKASSAVTHDRDGRTLFWILEQLSLTSLWFSLPSTC